MPTAGTSQIMGNSEGLDPITANIYNRRVLAGEFICMNKYLVQDLIKLVIHRIIFFAINFLESLDANNEKQADCQERFHSRDLGNSLTY